MQSKLWMDSQDYYSKYLIIHFDYLIILVDYFKAQSNIANFEFLWKHDFYFWKPFLGLETKVYLSTLPILSVINVEYLNIQSVQQLQ